MSQPTFIGTCSLCGKSFTRASITNHVKSCAAAPQPPGQSFHLFVEARHDKTYWMHLAVPVEAGLYTVDAFLRGIWVECCGHLSAFRIAGENYNSDYEESEDPGMDVELSRILEPGMKFSYEYDFGSTTALNLKVLGTRDSGTPEDDVQLLARNDAPAVACQRCGSRPATQICADCVNRGKGWLCESCAKAHECGTEMCLPVVNSPRAGVCGYGG